MCTDVIGMGRKRNQGKARRAAKAKAREEVEDGANNNNLTTANNGTRKYKSPTEVFMDSNSPKCWHNGNDSLVFTCPFVDKFHESFIDSAARGDRSLPECLMAARHSTMNEFADKWNDSYKLEMAMSFFLSAGTQLCLEGDYFNARFCATSARFIEQYIAVELKQTQALPHWIKMEETYLHADEHSLVKFFRHRIPCSCLDEKYEEVKQITKMGTCYNRQCSIPGREVERSKTKYCSRCRCATYCSRECQEVDWSRHKPHCDRNTARIAKFEVKQQNM